MPKKANKAKRPKDKYYQLAKEQGYRARSAFKLIQLNKKYDFLAKSGVLIDLCAAPGGWLQVAAKYMPAGSTIIGVDLMPIKAIRGVISHREDITTQECRTLLRRDMGNKKADVVLHDGAPNVGQNWQKDAFSQSELVLHSLRLATEFLRPHGLFITKVFRSTDYNSLLWVFQQLFGKVEATKPHSSRNASAEIFVVCRDYKAPHRIDPKLLDARYVFKETDDLTGTGTGVAGGGGGSTLHVLDRKAGEHNKRQREGYDDALGPLLTRRVPVMTFLRAGNPVRVLTDASCLVFDADSAAAGVDALAKTTPEIVSCCGDLKVLGKKDFRDLLRWRVAVRRAIPAAAAPLRKRRADRDGAAGGAGDDAAGSDGEEDEEDGSDSESGSDAGSGSGSEDEDKEVRAELSAAAAAELHRRKRERKRDGKARSRALRRQRLGAHLKALDLLDSDDRLFSLSHLSRLARRAGEGGGPDGDGDVLASIREVDLDAPSKDAAAAAAYSAAVPRADGRDDSEDEDDGAAAAMGGAGGPSSSSSSSSAAAAAEGDGEDEEDELDVDPAEGGDVVAALRARDRTARLSALEDEFDAVYAHYLARREKRAVQAAAIIAADGGGKGAAKKAAAAASGTAPAGAKASRLDRLRAQAVMTQAALEGQLDEEHTKYVTLLASAREKAEAAAAAADARLLTGSKRKREADGADDDDDDDDDSSLDLSDEDEDGDDDEEGDDEDGEEEEGEDDDDDEDAADDAADRVLASRARVAAGGAGAASARAAGGGAGQALSAATKARRWFSSDLFAGLDGADAAAAGGAGAGAGAAAAGKSAAAAAKGKRPAMAVDSDSDGGDDGGKGDAGSVDSEGAPKWLSGLPRSGRDKWHDKLRRQRERKERSAARIARKEGNTELEVVSSGGAAEADADDEFARVVNAMAKGQVLSAATGADKAKSKGRGAAADSDDDDDDAREGEDAATAAKRRQREALIRAGMGAAIADLRGKSAAAAFAAGEGSGFEVVAGDADGKGKRGRRRRGAADDSDSDSSGSGVDSDDEDDAAEETPEAEGGAAAMPDPRMQLYDEDTHAELLALGRLMRKHSSAKQLVDASYNRYAFDDKADELPAWFAGDERRHYRPQLPVTKAEVDAVRERFREIAARPVAKVAEARARKRMQVEKKATKLKRQAEGLQESEEVQGRSRERALQRLYKGTEIRKPSSVYVVSSSGGSHGTAQAKAKRRGSKVTVVDPRLKKDRRAAIRTKVKALGGGRKAKRAMRARPPPSKKARKQ